ncbi:MAG: hypothetical protein E7327_09500 [Clostridiales bacterium]|nr:hypothetical protein [Clostridiales bacterium]
MKYRLLLLMAALLVAWTGVACAFSLPADLFAIEECAFEGDLSLTGVMNLPKGILTVEKRAFAATGLHGLAVPEGCVSVDASVLAGTQAAYLLLRDAATVLAGGPVPDVPFVFAPADSSLSSLPGFYALETLVEENGLYYSVTPGAALPLCAMDCTELSGTLMIPKTVAEQPVRSLETLKLIGCDEVTGLQVPSCVDMPGSLPVEIETYMALSITEPVPSTLEAMVGDEVTWTTSTDGAYGAVSYIWTFNTDGSVTSSITAEPTITYVVDKEGLCIASVTAVDESNDRAFATGVGVTVGPPIPRYRALLVGNTYPNTSTELHGCDTDVAAVSTVLGSMSTTDYSVNTLYNVNASTILNAIPSTFANARVCDVSLFYFSGHGTSTGSLVGTGNTTITVSKLRTALDQIPGTKIVIVDACYSGNLIGKSTDPASPSSFASAFISAFSAYTKADLASNGYIVMTACSKSQMSQSLTDGSIYFGAFTYGVCYGSGYDEWNQCSLSTMPADKNGDGAITLGEAYAMAVERVNWLKEMVSMEQVAQYHGDDDFVLWIK